MTEYFGVPAVAVMFICLALLALCVAAVAAVAARNRILFEMGLRNIPRRRAQSVLIVLGLTLSTAIVAAALATGDTVRHSITNETFTRLGHVDEIIQVRDNQRETSLREEQIAAPGLIPSAIANSLYADLRGFPGIDGVIAGIRYPTVGVHLGPDFQTLGVDPRVVLIGLDPAFLGGFEDDFIGTDGVRRDLLTLREDEAFVNESAAKSLGVGRGNSIDVYVDRLPRTLHVVGVLEDRMLTGWTQGEAEGVLVRLDRAQRFAEVGGVGFIAISNSGGVREGLDGTDAIAGFLDRNLENTAWEVSRIKQDRIERAEDVGEDMVQIFVVLGLFTVAAGELLVFLIMVMLAAERRSEMGMARAVGMRRLQLIESFMAEGMAYSVTAAAAGALLGVVVSLGMTRAMDYIFERFDVAIAFHPTVESVVIAYCVGVVLTFATVTLSAWRVSSLSVVAAIRDQDEPRRAAGGPLLAAAALLAAGGVALTVLAVIQENATSFGGGVSMLIGGALVAGLRLAPQRERAIATAGGLAVLVLWVLVAGESLRALTGPLDEGLSAFIVGGVMMVAAATLIIMFNAGVLIAAARALGVLHARSAPTVVAAASYPMANRFRTGMTVAMISLVVFALVLISTLSLNFRNLFLDESSRGGFDVVVDESPSNRFLRDPGNPHGPLGEALDRSLKYDTRHVDLIAQVLVGNPRVTQIAQMFETRTGPQSSFTISGVDRTFVEQNTIGLQARARGFDSDEEVWLRLLQDPSFAVIDGSAVPGINYANVAESRFTLEGFESGDTSFEPIAVRVIDTAQRKDRVVRIIGIMERGPSETFPGLYVGAQALGAQGLTPAHFSRYYIRLQDGLDATAEAEQIEQALLLEGVTSESIHDRVADNQRLSAAFFYLVQGFLALGLGVGLAALGVIAFRTVVERRQQIGLMRAMGFSRAAVGLVFVLESAFIALIGIVTGTALALLLANRMLASDQFAAAGFQGFSVPWLQVIGMAALVFIAAVVTTLIPSRQASAVPPAEALRYE